MWYFSRRVWSSHEDTWASSNLHASPSVSFSHQGTYLSGKEPFGPVLSQGRKATRPRTLACTDGLLSSGQDLIQFVCGE